MCVCVSVFVHPMCARGCAFVCARVSVCARARIYICLCHPGPRPAWDFSVCIYNFKYRHKVANRTSLRLSTLTSAIRYWLSASSLLRRSRSRRAIWIQYRWLRTYIIFHKNVKTSEQQNHDDWHFFYYEF